MKNIILLFVFISSLAFSQEYDYQQLCINCAQAQGFYCGDDPSNWTQYAPNGCVQNSWINDGCEDCVDAADENAEGPTLTTTTRLRYSLCRCDRLYIRSRHCRGSFLYL